MRLPIIVLAFLFLAACGAQEPPLPTQASTVPPSLTATGPASTLQADDDDDVRMGAWVVKVDDLANQGDPTVKLYGMAGGDPAMNGLQTFLAFYLSPAEGWQVFRIGDFLDYRVLSQAIGRVDIEIEESVMDAETTRISSRKRRVILAWAPGIDDGPPTSVTVTPTR